MWNFQIGTPKPWKIWRSENFTKISRQVLRHPWQRETETTKIDGIVQARAVDGIPIEPINCLCPSTVTTVLSSGMFMNSDSMELDPF